MPRSEDDFRKLRSEENVLLKAANPFKWQNNFNEERSLGLRVGSREQKKVTQEHVSLAFSQNSNAPNPACDSSDDNMGENKRKKPSNASQPSMPQKKKNSKRESPSFQRQFTRASCQVKVLPTHASRFPSPASRAQTPKPQRPIKRP